MTIRFAGRQDRRGHKQAESRIAGHKGHFRVLRPRERTNRVSPWPPIGYRRTEKDRYGPEAGGHTAFLKAEVLCRTRTPLTRVNRGYQYIPAGDFHPKSLTGECSWSAIKICLTHPVSDSVPRDASSSAWCVPNPNADICQILPPLTDVTLHLGESLG